jgi:hypothetical protein
MKGRRKTAAQQMKRKANARRKEWNMKGRIKKTETNSKEERNYGICKERNK